MFQELLLRWVGRRAAAKLLLREFRPQVEPLEDRLLLAGAVATWQVRGVTGAGDWNTRGDWDIDRVPVDADTARFNQIAAAPTLSMKVAITGLDVWAAQGGAAWNTTLDLAGNELKATGLTNVRSAAMAVGKPQPGIAADAVFTLKSTGAKATLSTASLDVGFAGFQSLFPVQNRALLNVSKDVTLAVGGTVQVGGQTTGVLTVNAGGSLKGDGLLVGGISSTAPNPNYVSTVVVTGVGATAEFKMVSLGAQNGYGGPAVQAGNPIMSALTIDKGGKVTVGAGAAAAAKSLQIGTDYRGVVNVLGGSQLTTGGSVFVGSFLGVARGTGLLNVQDDKSVVTVGGVLAVGADTGRGELTVNAGGKVSAAQLDVGNAKATGKVTVAGAVAQHATLTVSGTSKVHQRGTLDVQNLGDVTSTGAFTIDAGGSVKVHNGGTIDAQAGGTNNGKLEVDTGGGFKTHPAGMINKGKITIASANGGPGGTFALQGNFTQTAPGELDVTLAGNVPGTGYSVLSVTPADGPDGNVTLGGSLDVTASYAPAPFRRNGTAGDYFTVVTATGTLSGQFDPVTGLNLPDPTQLGLPAPTPGTEYRWRVVYDRTGTYDSALAQSDPALVSQPWVGHGTHEVVLLIEEVLQPSPATTTTLSTSSGSSAFGQSVTFTAVVASGAGTPAGAVTFYDGSSPLGTAALDATGTATLTTSALAVGSHTITAYYQGGTSFRESDSVSLPQSITTAASGTTLASSLNPSILGDFVTFTATVAGTGATPTGSVNFMDGGTSLGSISLDDSGTATFTTSSLSAGSHTITAVYGGDTNFAGSTSAALTQTVGAASASTATTLTSSLASSAQGASVVFTAAVTGHGGIPSGSVTFYDGTTALGAADLDGAGVATFATNTLALGGHSITASYGGDDTFNASTSAALAQTVSAASASTTTVSSSSSPVSYGTAVTFTATVTGGGGTPGGTVTFYDGDVPLGTGTLGATGTATLTTALLTVGSHMITAVYGGSAIYGPSTSAVLTETITPAASSTAVTSSANPSVHGQSVTFTATVSGPGLPEGIVSFHDGVTLLGTGTLDDTGTATFTTSGLSVGQHTITAVFGGDGSFAGSTSAALTQTVN